MFWIFFDQIKIPKRKQNAKTFFQRELLRYVVLFIINFYEQFFKTKLNFQRDNLKLSLKITYKDKITDIKKIP